MNFELDRDELLRIFSVITHSILFLQMITWTLNTKHDHSALRAIRLVWAAMTLLLAVVTWKYSTLWSYEALHVAWQSTIVVHLYLIKKLATSKGCNHCLNTEHANISLSLGKTQSILDSLPKHLFKP